MDPRQRMRLLVAHRVMTATRSKTFRDSAFVTAGEGSVFITALCDDTMGIFFDQLRDTGAPINVAVVSGEQLVICAMAPLPQQSEHALREIGADGIFPVDRDMTVGMLIDYLQLLGRPIVVRGGSPKISLELVDGPRPLNL